MCDNMKISARFEQKKALFYKTSNFKNLEKKVFSELDVLFSGKAFN